MDIKQEPVPESCFSDEESNLMCKSIKQEKVFHDNDHHDDEKAAMEDLRLDFVKKETDTDTSPDIKPEHKLDKEHLLNYPDIKQVLHNLKEETADLDSDDSDPCFPLEEDNNNQLQPTDILRALKKDNFGMLNDDNIVCKIIFI